MYGFKYVGSLYSPGVQPMTRKFHVTANEVITKGDAVILTSGKLDSGADVDGASLVGVANETVTGNSTGTNHCEVIVARPGDLYLADTASDGSYAATQVGYYFDQGNCVTAVQQISDTTASATAGQWMLVEHNPQGFGLDSDTSIGLFTPTQTVFSSQYNE